MVAEPDAKALLVDEQRQDLGQDDPPAPDGGAGGRETDDPPHDSQQELARQERGTGGDAEAAGSIADREAVAQDRDRTWSTERPD